MIKTPNITILTTTYNRANEINQLYKSLLNQTNKSFKWLIIDDGSQDNTLNVIQNFSTEYLPITYLHKKNGGKHTAINFGLKFVDTELVMIVDSDDTLTNDAIESIIQEWGNLSNRKKNNVAGMIFLKQDTKGKISGIEFPRYRFIENYNSFILNNNKYGESADVWVTEILKKYPYPVYSGEKYVPETTVWALIAREYDMLFVNKVIYIYEYLDGGLTDSGRKLRIDNPKGSMENARVWLNSKFSIRISVKKMILYICYGFFAEYTVYEMYKNAPLKFLFIILLPLGYFLKRYWSKKFKMRSSLQR